MFLDQYIGLKMICLSPGSCDKGITRAQIEAHKGEFGIRGSISDWWFGTFGLFFHILEISSSQLTFIFFRGVGQPPTRYYSYIMLYPPYTIEFSHIDPP